MIDFAIEVRIDLPALLPAGGDEEIGRAGADGRGRNCPLDGRLGCGAVGLSPLVKPNLAAGGVVTGGDKVPVGGGECDAGG